MEGEEPRSTPRARGPSPDDEALGRIQALGRAGRFGQAWQVARRFGPLDAWRGVAARAQAGWLALHLGAPRLAWRIRARAYRESPGDARTQVAYARVVLEQRGPFAAWSWLDAGSRDRAGAGAGAEAEAEAEAERLFFQAHVLSLLRDFESAHATIDEAIALAPDDRDRWGVRALVLEHEDRVEDALAVAREGLAASADDRFCLQLTAHDLVLLDRREEALEVLTGGVARFESAHVALQLAMLERDLHRHDAARASLLRYAELSPLMEASVADDLHARLSENAYRRGDVAASIAMARRVRRPQYQEVAERMERAPPQARRVELDVPFVRQHRVTCVPATLTAIGRHFRVPVEHLGVAEAICYDGTPVHSARRWAEENGWVAGEFTVGWESARWLLDRGVPFVLLTAFAAEGHAQAVVGYDEIRGTFSVRDPSRPDVGEADVASLLAAFRSTGPHGLWLVPAAEASRVDGQALPDAALWDRLDALQRALSAHDRRAAGLELQELVARAADHPITFSARRALAAYDSDLIGMRETAEGLLAQFPGDARAELDLTTCMGELSPRAERLARLEAICARPGRDPIFCERLADELHEDAREHRRAARLLRPAMRARPHRARPLLVAAGMDWSERRFDRALSVYRFAACVDPTGEDGTRAYFAACRIRGHTERVLTMMRQRQARLGSQSSLPLQTLHGALDRLERTAEAEAALDQGLADRPRDGELLLYAARAYASSGRVARAQELLARAEGLAPAARWSLCAAEVARSAGDPRRVELLRRVLQSDPLAIDAHRALVDALAAAAGPAEATAHIEAALQRFPHHQPLLHLLMEWSARSGPEAREAAARRALAIHPADAWATRELALSLSARGETEPALLACERARAIEPNDVRLHLVFGRVLSDAGRVDAAREAWREAIRRWADASMAIAELLSLAPDKAAREVDLAFVERELADHAIDGTGILAWQRAARAELDDDDVLSRLGGFREARPELWPAWVAHAKQLVTAGRVEDGRALARETAERFPLVAPAWVALADAEGAAGDRDGELRALERALAVAPLEVGVVARVSLLLEQAGDAARACAILERALASDPEAATATVTLAGILERAGRADDATDRLRRAIRLDPESSDLWQCFHELQAKRGRLQDTLAYAQTIAREHPWSARVQGHVATMAQADGRPNDALDALGRALAIDPRDVQTHDRRIVLFALLGRMEDAKAACAPQVFGAQVPLELRGRAAWLKMRAGDSEGAARDLRTLLADHAAYTWGWVLLVEACERLCDPSGRLLAAERLVRVSPESGGAHHALGEARLAVGDRRGAKTSFLRAAHLGGGHVPAMERLVYGAVTARDSAEAERHLAALRACDAEAALPSELRVALLVGDVARASAAFTRACASPGLAPASLARMRRLLVLAGLGGDAYDRLERAATAPDGSPSTAHLWALASVERGDGRVEAWLRRERIAPSAPARAAMVAAATRLAARGRGAALRWLVWRLPRRLRADSDVRAACDTALASSAKRMRASVLRPAFLLAPLAILVVALPLLFALFGAMQNRGDALDAILRNVNLGGVVPFFVAFLVARLLRAGRRGR